MCCEEDPCRGNKWKRDEFFEFASRKMVRVMRKGDYPCREGNE